MSVSKIANVIDTEYDNNRLIEIGLTTVDLEKLEIINTYSLPIKTDKEISPEISLLTGWTTKKLQRSGFDIYTALRLLFDKHGFRRRLIVIDTPDELDIFSNYMEYSDLPKNTLNVSYLFSIFSGQFEHFSLEYMLEFMELKFEGKRHRADSDSYNIARLTIALLSRLK